MKIRELLTDESKWCKDYLALDSNGMECDPDTAVQWCLLGACDRGYGFGETFDRLTERFGEGGVSRWNDAPERTFEDVRRLVEEMDI